MFAADPIIIFTLELAALAALTICAGAALKAWRGWLELRKLELAAPASDGQSFPGTAGSRIEIADLKERIRKLEAIAAGVDL